MGYNQYYSPFGVATKRFATIGFHPNLDPTGSMNKAGGLGPGHYGVPKNECCYKKYIAKECWKRKTELEEFSQMLGFRNAEILHKRKEAQKANGPGTLDIPETLFKPQSHNVKKNVAFGKAQRFRNPIKNTNPSPGSYGKNHEPRLRFEESQPPKHQWTPLPTFEWDGFIDRFKIGRLNKPWSLPPNRYEIKKKGGIDELLAKRVSKRGPFDCFTGPRDGTTIKGYFAPSAFKGAKIWPRSLPSEIDRLKTRCKRRFGLFLKADRFTKRPGTRNMLTDLVMCPKNPNDPGPGHYDVSQKYDMKENKYPFQCSVLNARPVKKWELMPGVGRYDAQLPKCKYKSVGESWMFKSTVKREVYKVITYNSF